MNAETPYSVPVGVNLLVEVDTTGNVQVAVRAEGPGVGLRTGSDGFARADITHVAGMTAALKAAQLFAGVVFPQGLTPAEDREFTWQQRRMAYNALVEAKKLTEGRPGDVARYVTQFLRDYTDLEQQAFDGIRKYQTMVQHAMYYERWW
jgi:hypothetical protein